MKKNYVSNSEESTRMFKSGFFELFSKVHFSIPIIIYIPFIFYLSYESFVSFHSSVLSFVAYFFFGIFCWSFTEYILHRFVFHYHPKVKWAQRLHFIMHGVHHDYPSDKYRLVMPPIISIALAVIFYSLFKLIFVQPHLYSFFAGFVLGYLFYDITHYAIHHFNFKGNIWREIKRHHMLHHYDNPDLGYGVSSKLWDLIFRTDFLKKNNLEN
jgi:4-hydroxysphinganine ceramide fatty acyl 2-hydroxylase